MVQHDIYDHLHNMPLLSRHHARLDDVAGYRELRFTVCGHDRWNIHSDCFNRDLHLREQTLHEQDSHGSGGEGIHTGGTGRSRQEC